MNDIHQTRALTEDDLDQMIEIFTSPQKVMRTYLDRTEKEIIDDFHYPGTTFVGTFNNGILTSFMKYVVWQRLPMFQVGNLNIRKGTLNRYEFSTTGSPVIPIIDFILQSTETLGLYNWYYNRSLSPAYHRIQLHGKDMLKNSKYGFDKEKDQYRYDRFIDEVVPAGCRSKYDIFFSMTGNKIFTEDYMVVKCSLKPEYRSTINYFDNTEIRKCI